MKKTPFKLLIFCLLIPAWVEASSSGKDQLNYFLNQVITLEAMFEQTVLDDRQQVIGRAVGKLYMKRPNQFRWEYHEPYKQEIIADGFQVWLYEFDLEQTSVQSQSSALKGSPALLLSHKEPIENHFEVVDIGERLNLHWVELIPKYEDSQYIRILVAFSDNKLIRLELSDKLDQITRFQFSDIKHNIELEDRLFEFVPPPGTAVFDH